MGDDYQIIITAVYLAFYGFPLFFIGCTKHFHTDWDMAHFKYGFDNLVTLFDKVNICAADKYLIALVHSLAQYQVSELGRYPLPTPAPT